MQIDPQTYPDWLQADLRSDHAGETGAVWIYKGILAVSRDPEVRRFATDHLKTEQAHLAGVIEIFPSGHSRLIPLWRVMGFLTGAVPALLGQNAVFRTIQAVETFVDRHYQEQIDRLDREALFPAVRDRLERYRQEEVHHRDDAADRLAGRPSALIRGWCALVGFGSVNAVRLAKVF